MNTVSIACISLSLWIVLKKYLDYSGVFICLFIQCTNRHTFCTIHCASSGESLCIPSSVYFPVSLAVGLGPYDLFWPTDCEYLTGLRQSWCAITISLSLSLCYGNLGSQIWDDGIRRCSLNPPVSGVEMKFPTMYTRHCVSEK